MQVPDIHTRNIALDHKPLHKQHFITVNIYCCLSAGLTSRTLHREREKREEEEEEEEGKRRRGQRGGRGRRGKGGR